MLIQGKKEEWWWPDVQNVCHVHVISLQLEAGYKLAVEASCLHQYLVRVYLSFKRSVMLAKLQH